MARYKLTIHIGMPKTGSSAIQTWLSLNTGLLKSRGIGYADLAPEAKWGAITSGNGVVLRNMLMQKHTEDTDTLFETFFGTYFGAHEEAIVSSELLVSADHRRLRRFSEFLTANDCETRVIAFVRDIYPLARALHQQAVKRHGFAEGFSNYVKNLFLDTQLVVLDRWRDVFEDLRVANYGEVRPGYEETVSEMFFDSRFAIGKGAFEQVNTSLTHVELAFLIRANAKYGKRYSKLLSDALMKGPRPTQIRTEAADPEIVEDLRTRFQATVDALNSRYLNTGQRGLVISPLGESVEHDRAESQGGAGDAALNLDGVIDTFVGVVEKQALEIQLLSARLALEQGDTEKGLGHTANALTLSPSHPEALRLKEHLGSGGGFG